MLLQRLKSLAAPIVAAITTTQPAAVAAPPPVVRPLAIKPEPVALKKPAANPVLPPRSIAAKTGGAGARLDPKGYHFWMRHKGVMGIQIFKHEMPAVSEPHYLYQTEEEDTCPHRYADGEKGTGRMLVLKACNGSGFSTGRIVVLRHKDYPDIMYVWDVHIASMASKKVANHPKIYKSWLPEDVESCYFSILEVSVTAVNEPHFRFVDPADDRPTSEWYPLYTTSRFAFVLTDERLSFLYSLRDNVMNKVFVENSARESIDGQMQLAVEFYVRKRGISRLSAYTGGYECTYDEPKRQPRRHQQQARQTSPKHQPRQVVQQQARPKQGPARSAAVPRDNTPYRPDHGGFFTVAAHGNNQALRDLERALNRR